MRCGAAVQKGNSPEERKRSLRAFCEVVAEGGEHFGLEIVCGFDVDHALIGTQENGIEIYSVYQIANKVEELGIEIAILAVPSASAQDIADRFVNAGIKGIWNFVPIHIKAKEDVIVENVNLASSFAVLQHKLRNEEL